MRTLLSAAAVVLLSAPALCAAQAPAPAGFVLGVHGMQTTQRPEAGESTAMGGARLHLGYAPTPYLAVFLELPASLVARGEEYAYGAYYRGTSDAVLSGADLGIRLLAPLGRVPVTPYVTAAAGIRAVTQTLIVQDTVFYRDGRPAGAIGDTTRASISGRAASAGGGLLVRLTSSLALDGGFTVGRGHFDRITVESTVDGRAAVNIPADRYRVQSASVGLTWASGGRRRR
jgi:hypothetical protein